MPTNKEIRLKAKKKATRKIIIQLQEELDAVLGSAASLERSIAFYNSNLHALEGTTK